MPAPQVRCAPSWPAHHLLKAGAQWLLHLEGKRDWETRSLPKVR